MSKIDLRTEFIQLVNESLITIYSAEETDIISSIITKALNNYELTERSTDLVIYDDENTRLLKRYCACLLIDGKSEKTVHAYRYTILKMDECLRKPFKETDAYDIRYFLACEKERGVADQTLENTRANLSAFFQWLTMEEFISKNPCLRIKPIKCAEKVRLAFSSVEIDKIRSSCKSLKERAIIEFLLSSGVRVSELCQMKLTDVDFETLAVHVVHGKGSKERVTYIDELTKTHLQRYLLAREETGDFLFFNRLHKQINPGGIRSILKTIEKRSGVSNIHPHRFRRTFATNLSRRGMDIQEIRKLLGHSNINTTLAYIHTDDSRIHASYRQFTA